MSTGGSDQITSAEAAECYWSVLSPAGTFKKLYFGPRYTN